MKSNQIKTNKKEIKAWLDIKRIENYQINDDLTVDVNGDVYLAGEELSILPIQFREVMGYFNIENNKLKSLKGCPKIVHKGFFCGHNKLKSLEYVPICESLHCDYNELTNLDYLPVSHINTLNAHHNKITQLENLKINADLFIIDHNPVQTFTYETIQNWEIKSTILLGEEIKNLLNQNNLVSSELLNYMDSSDTELMLYFSELRDSMKIMFEHKQLNQTLTLENTIHNENNQNTNKTKIKI